VVDHVFLRILNSQLVNICEEMGYAMMRTSYSTMFSEGLDFSTMILEPGGDLIAMQNLNPAMLGQALFSGRWVIEDLGADGFEPGDVVVHNDPYRGGSHMPEHLLIAPFHHRGALRGWVCNVGHPGRSPRRRPMSTRRGCACHRSRSCAAANPSRMSGGSFSRTTARRTLRGVILTR
jgi:N-methylhydantoinase B/oxoprolinase/acetone carboxylase alpha subunit